MTRVAAAVAFGICLAAVGLAGEAVADSAQSKAEEVENRAQRALSARDYKKAADLYELAISKWKAVYRKEPMNSEGKNSLARSRQNFIYALGQPNYVLLDEAEKNLRAKRFAKAAEQFRESMVGYQEASRRVRQPEFAQNLKYATENYAAAYARAASKDTYSKLPHNLQGTGLRRCGDEELQKKNYADAANYYRRAVAAWNTVLRANSKDQKAESDLAHCKQNLEIAQANAYIAQFKGIAKNRGAAPAFALDSMRTGKVRLSDFRGKTALVVFWTADCGYCRAELPKLHEFYRRHRNQGLVVIGLNAEPVWNGSRRPDARTMARKFSFPVAWANEDTINKFGRPLGVPAMFWVDSQGRLAKVVKDRKIASLTKDFNTLK